MTTFALVHGAWHGAWCWERLIPLLEQRGHQVIAPELPSDDPAASFEDYADVVCAALDDGSAGDDVVLVGHSLGGHTIPLVAARRPVRHLVYLAALVPEIGRSLRDQMRADPEMLNRMSLQALSRPDEQRRNTWIDEELTCALIFGDAEAEAAHAAFARLRPQALNPYASPFPLAQFPLTDRTYVVCTGDQMVNPAWSRQVARERLDARLVELPGDHSPALSRPTDLADILLGVAG
ncbi:alpha/beta fold hydrolase [Mycolicibacterium komossense]|uniref:Alpha/beta hydrolase n=1 Tax=Mycolicibacterium komossense TaxID=1779 RepID=A0ABT3CMA9_9MYCO|nr:alpha/beta hydrolase [Mycolicibacterium komossense]MCV7230631.1 alpha/beta hydrolase [Mycolicibacterium komossense]